MVMIIFYTLTSNSPNYWGKIGGMESGGSFIFTCIVLVVNMKLLISSFEITGYLLFLVIASISVYVFCFWFASWYSPEASDYGVFTHLMTFTETYFTGMFFAFSYVLIDAGMRYASLEINTIYMRRREIQEYHIKLKRDYLSSTAVHKQIKYKGKSPTLSLITHSLTLCFNTC